MKFKRDYFINSKISNYQDYTSKKFNGLADDLIKELSLEKTNKILDFGCATGGLLKELKERGFKFLKGTDISYWAVTQAKINNELLKQVDYFNLELLSKTYDYVFCFDVLEHIDTYNLQQILSLFAMGKIKKGFIVRVPVSAKEGEHFVLPVSRNDKTHIQIHTKEWWIDLFKKHGFKLKKVISQKEIYDSEGVFSAWFEK